MPIETYVHSNMPLIHSINANYGFDHYLNFGLILGLIMLSNSCISSVLSIIYLSYNVVILTLAEDSMFSLRTLYIDKK